MTTTTAATNPRPSTTGVPGWDVDVEVSPGGDDLVLYGEVTLAPQQSDGRPAAYGGDASMWVSGALLVALKAQARGDATALRDLLDDIVAAAADAIEAAGVDPAAVPEEEEATADE